ncbi:hypothetical protein L3Q82_020100 [Scortum barcoo]|uniref:Uncharacterized protein n=1 Tax=Scortum barcoo TaxID=214431 RepID=A0ACB8VEB8_9TELE|nr:hypothetical protein L3Q82_020100 [Scortum barcoo]
MMVYRPWTQKDMLDSLAHLPDPTVSGTRFSDELLIFCKEFSPTTHELRRLLKKKLGLAAYDKIRSACQREARQVHPVWENEENVAYLNALDILMTTLKVAFPTKVDITKISNCKQRRDEMVADYYTRLHLLFNDHGGMTEPTERGDTPMLWESHMIIWFLDGLLPHISAAIKKSCVGYEDARLTDLIRHAKHTERQITAEKTKKSNDREKQAHVILLILVKTFAENMAGNEQQRPARNWRGPGFNRRGRDDGRRGHSWVFINDLLSLDVHAFRSVHLVDEYDKFSPHTEAIISDSSLLPPALREVPPSLWARRKDLDDGEPHNCLAELQVVCSPRPDLSDAPLTNPDLILYVDGSATRDPLTGVNRVGFAVVSDNATLVSGPLPHHLSAQAAEMVALTEACKFAAGKTVTIYTDSRYAFGVVHDFGALWKAQEFFKSDGKPILHHSKDHCLHQTTGGSCLLLCLLLPPSPCTPCNPGDFVVVKDFRRKHWHWQAKRWHGPFQILLTYSHGCESGRTSNLDPRQPLQKGTSTCRNHHPPIITTHTHH